MKKRFVLWCTVGVMLFVLTVGSMAVVSMQTQTTQEIIDVGEMTEITSVTLGQITINAKKEATILALLKEKNYTDEEIKKALKSYASCVVDFNMTLQEELYIMELVAKEYDFLHLLSIYSYLKKINEDPYLADEIYNTADGLFENEFWLPDAYAKYKNLDVLSVEDIHHYVVNGISIDEIMHCDEMSLQTKASITDILDQRQFGKSWYAIAAPLYELPENVQWTVEPTLEEILNVAHTAIRAGSNIKDACVIENGMLEVKESIVEKIDEKAEKQEQVYAVLHVEEEVQ